MNLSFLVGLEFHRVLSFEKLFCKCRFEPSLESEEFFEVEYPKHELTHKFYYNNQYCRYEKEESFPLFNEKHLKKACELALLFGAKILPEVVFCRKLILDNSIPKGYQLSGLIATGGKIKLSDNTEVLISQIYLEEDSCTKNKKNLYEVSRCGLPLIEITTKACFLTEVQVIELIKKTEDLLNTFQNIPIKSGMIRFDLNISRNSKESRVEFKGCDSSDFKGWLYSHYETLNETSTRKLDYNHKSSYFLRHISNSDRLWPESELPFFSTLKRLTSLCKKKLKYVSVNLKFKNRIHSKRFVKTCGFKALEVEPMKLYMLYQKTKSFKALKLYLNETENYHSLMEQKNEKCLSFQQCLDLYQQYSLEKKTNFFKEYRYKIPRSFSLWLNSK